MSRLINDIKTSQHIRTAPLPIVEPRSAMIGIQMAVERILYSIV